MTEERTHRGGRRGRPRRGSYLLGFVALVVLLAAVVLLLLALLVSIPVEENVAASAPGERARADEQEGVSSASSSEGDPAAGASTMVRSRPP